MGIWNVYPMTNDDALDVIDEINKKGEKANASHQIGKILKSYLNENYIYSDQENKAFFAAAVVSASLNGFKESHINNEWPENSPKFFEGIKPMKKLIPTAIKAVERMIDMENEFGWKNYKKRENELKYILAKLKEA
jgi:hypothetical protein